jgi:hypothetical protein
LISGFAIPLITHAPGRKTILENLTANRDFSTLAGAVRSAGLDNVLDGPAAYTLFAPDNKAFRKHDGKRQDSLKLAGLAAYHIVPGKVAYSDLARLPEIRTVSGKILPVDRHGREIVVGGARVLSPAIESNNGVIYRVEKVISPPGLAIPRATVARGAKLDALRWVTGALTLGGLAYYLLSRKKEYREPGTVIEPPGARHEEKPAAEEIGAKITAKPRLEIKAGSVKTSRPGETMKRTREAVSSRQVPGRTEIAKTLSLPLAGDAFKGLNMLIDNGTFRDKPEFIAFLEEIYRKNDIGSLMSEGVEPHESRIIDIIHKAGIARDFFDTDIKKYLVPLLLAGFVAIHEHDKKRPTVKAM